MNKLSRRDFHRLVSQSGLTVVSLPIVSCGRAVAPAGRDGLSSTEIYRETVTIYDFRMHGWSTLGSGRLGSNGVLSAEIVKANEEIELPYTQDPHGHRFTLTKEHFADLRHQRKIAVLTTTALGHRHEVRIDPVADRVPGTEVEVPLNPGNSNPEPLQELEVYAALGSDANPRLYLATGEQIDAAQLKYCLAEIETCDRSNLWQATAPVSGDFPVPRFRGANPLALADIAQTEVVLTIKAEKDGKLYARRLKLTRK